MIYSVERHPNRITVFLLSFEPWPRPFFRVTFFDQRVVSPRAYRFMIFDNMNLPSLYIDFSLTESIRLNMWFQVLDNNFYPQIRMRSSNS